MVEKQNEQGAEEWDALVDQLRQVRQQVQEQGPLSGQQQAEATDAFRRGLAMLESQMNDMQGSGLKGSSGHW